ncbi:MAG: SDR family NAD(P)-dependent oxidoreductase [Bacteroides sp.]|nr:SDR family NAD(P)-dependent oxidoreductase [Bacteroides sp.]
MKRIIIMGATSGIGLRVAEIFAKAGWLVGAAGRKEKVLRKLQSDFPDRIRYAQININEQDAPNRLRDLIGRLGGMDIYFHVSGIGYENEALVTEHDTATAQTNVVGFTRMIDTAFRYFRSHGKRGRIAAVTSVAGTNGIGELASYSASKKYQQTYLTALDQLARMQNLDISFTDIRPGWIRTPLLNPDRVYPMTMSLDYAVVRIVRAIIARKRICIVDWRWNLLVRAWSMVPDRIWERIPLRVSTAATPSEDKIDKIIEKKLSKPEQPAAVDVPSQLDSSTAQSAIPAETHSEAHTEAQSE